MTEYGYGCTFTTVGNIEAAELTLLGLEQVLEKATDAIRDQNVGLLSQCGKALMEISQDGNELAFFPKVIVIEQLALMQNYKVAHALAHLSLIHWSTTEGSDDKKKMARDLTSSLFSGTIPFSEVRCRNAHIFGPKLQEWKGDHGVMQSHGFIVEFIEKHMTVEPNEPMVQGFKKAYPELHKH